MIKHTCTADSTGSYAGFLATVFRINKPDTFFGAIASAAPLTGVTADINATDAFAGWVYVRILTLISCASR